MELAVRFSVTHGNAFNLEDALTFGGGCISLIVRLPDTPSLEIHL